MKLIAPDYYTKFRCIAGLCKHSCCIGWEIDIDEDTLCYYNSVSGEFGDRLSESISVDETPHFRLAEHERCPFLNNKNLCDIIINLGEDSLCQICADHPRFRNFFDDRTEVGLGLCCEAACSLILENKEKVQLVELENDCMDSRFSDDTFISFRKEIFDILQDRSQGIDKRIATVLCKHSIALPELSLSQWADFYLSLERLDEAWTDRLTVLKNSDTYVDVIPEIAAEQLLVYFIYRHLAEGIYDGRLRERISFAVISVQIIRALCALCNEPVTEIARMYSSEIEYSEENIEALLSALAEADK